MSTATLSSKGQVTLPREIRKKLHLVAGEKIDFLLDEKTLTATLRPLNKHAQDIFGILHRPGRNKHISVEAMNQAVKDKFHREYT